MFKCALISLKRPFCNHVRASGWHRPVGSDQLATSLTETMALQVSRIAWESVGSTVQLVVPPLTAGDHKGNMGRIGVIGGSVDYCGAPYYAAMSALKFGADLSWVYCSQSSAIPIKSYSPELIVVPFYDDQVVLNMDSNDREAFNAEATKAIDVVANSPRVHVFLVGPGLGRNPNVIYIVGNIIHGAKTNDMPLVIDADGLWLITHNLNLIMGCANCVLTPNRPEFERLVEAAINLYSTKLQHGPSDADRGFYTALLSELCLVESDKATPLAAGGPSAVAVRRVHALSAALGGVTILRKGAMDIIACSDGTSLRTPLDASIVVGSNGHAGHLAGTVGVEAAYVVEARGAPRRCGGLGDIVSGVTATALHWALQRKELLQDLRRVADLPGVVTTTVRLDVRADSSTAAPSTGETNAGTMDGASLTRNAAVHACVFASILAKQAAELAFALKGRSMTAPDVVEQIGAAFRRLHPEG